MKNLSVLLISIFFFSCQQRAPKNNVSSTASDSIAVQKKVEVNQQIGDTILMNFTNEKGLYTAETSLDSIRSKIYVKFRNDKTGDLTANIKAEGNIRFNQIIFPDKTSDGPFSKELKIHLEQKGDYFLIIGHSLMADNPFYGKFKVQLDIQKE
ncbi:hypothetical protein N4T20_20210 [Flavobacterium sp. TR2]|uniref:hypothetical protein n=1 Tax=Flavobacterium sp. TR2 TaxID=2977321 RepID=UPI0021B12DA4|nr:hypothetical protein [Flavobacterium sp. TR2]UWY28031.1 hypothetical protein N4T20_20210 [Flavobacterium sp. TR2]